MKLFLKIFFWTSITFIGVCVLLALLGLILPIELINDKIENLYLGIRFFGLPLAIIFTLTGTIKKKHDLGTILGTVFTTIAVSFISFLIMIFVFFGSVCGWLTDDILFESKTNTSITIEARHYDCGATDTQRPKIKTYKVIKLSKYFIWSTKVDTNKIDKREWTRVNTETR